MAISGLFPRLQDSHHFYLSPWHQSNPLKVKQRAWSETVIRPWLLSPSLARPLYSFLCLICQRDTLTCCKIVPQALLSLLGPRSMLRFYFFFFFFQEKIHDATTTPSFVLFFKSHTMPHSCTQHASIGISLQTNHKWFQWEFVDTNIYTQVPEGVGFGGWGQMVQPK